MIIYTFHIRLYQLLYIFIFPTIWQVLTFSILPIISRLIDVYRKANILSKLLPIVISRDLWHGLPLTLIYVQDDKVFTDLALPVLFLVAADWARVGSLSEGFYGNEYVLRVWNVVVFFLECVHEVYVIEEYGDGDVGDIVELAEGVDVGAKIYENIHTFL